jgi:hypothetical protein
MKHWKNSAALLAGLLLATLLVVFLAMHPSVTSAQADKPAAPADKPAKSLEDMIKEIGVAYKSVGDGKFVVAFPVDDTTTVNMVVGESTLTTSDKFKMVTIACKVMDGTKEKKPSAAMLAKITDFDYQTDIGRVGLDDSNNVWYQSSLWKETVTTQTLTYDLVFADRNRQKLAKALKAIADEG